MPAIALVGEAWGQEEEVLAHPFVGPSGRELARMLQEAGILPAERIPFEPRQVRNMWLKQDHVSLHNVFNLHPKGNDIDTLCTNKAGDSSGLPPIRAGKYIRGEFLPELQRLSDELSRSRPNIVVALGNIPSWALFRGSGISKIRGTVRTETLTGRGIKTLPTYHPAAILRQWDNRPVTVFDLIKARRESAYPEVRRPRRFVHIAESIADIGEFYRDYIHGARILSFDIETRGREITCIGFAPSAGLSLVIPFVDTRRADQNYWPDLESELEAWRWVRRILAEPMPKLAHNGMYDVGFLWRIYGIPVNNFAEDTMLLHHSLQPESLKGLGFLGSIYTNEASWKIMRSQTIKRDD